MTQELRIVPPALDFLLKSSTKSMTHQKIIFTFIYFEHLLQSTFFKITTLQREWKECTNLKLEKVLTGKREQQQ